ncbi:unnamed protein product [Cyprideis torosa]|uniref:Uncharacterized protein n=1 Tax=Cyprideis torosa TaxID=163714 RepID=A0A7R8WCX7_9CRUS|nr:unnamed protein product [Cyprideis torosa]CAG0887989.1 unnamed protein product [Cyprideis torosa]
MAFAARRMGNRIFVGNLPWTIGSAELRDYFSQFGQVVHTQVLFDKQTGLSRGFGFVGFQSQESMNKALDRNPHFLEGYYLNVDHHGGRVRPVGGDRFQGRGN